VGHATHDVPHPVASSSAAHLAVAPVPQRCVPAAHAKSQVVPSQIVALAPGGFAQDVQLAPHESTLVFDAQMPLQSCVPVGQTPEQEDAVSMHVPTHSFFPVGHAGWHAVPSQLVVPPAGAAHAVHDVVPQLPTDLLLTQVLPHR